MENNLPEGWATSTLQELCNMVYGKGLLTKFLTEDGYSVFGANGIIGKYSKYIYEKEQIIISCRGAASGVIHKTVPFAFVTSNSIVLQLNSNEIDLDYFKHSLASVDRSKIVTGSAQPQITIDNLNDLEIPIAPLSEQLRIVAKLEAVIKKIENNKQRLEKIPKLLKRFRQSVLATAVSGKLTESWRTDNGIDEEWEYMKATDACKTVASGSTPKNNPFFEKEEIPYLKVYNIVNQKIDFFYKPQYIKRAIHEKELKRCKVYPNDVLINIVGPPLGKVALMPDTFPEWNINQAIVLFRPKEFLSSIFLYYILRDGKQIKDIELELRGTAGQLNISLTQCRNFDFPIPKPEEQNEIIRKVEKLFAFADKLEVRYTKAKQMIDKLPQSLLAKAFRGELVPQDSEDEPASELLERIKAKKEKLAAEKEGKKAKEYSIEKNHVKIAAEKKVKYKKVNA